MALSLTEAEYIALNLKVKEVTWLCLLFTKLGLLQPDQQYALLKISENNKTAHAIYQDLEFKREEEYELENRSIEYPIIIPLKGNNQGSIALVHKLIFYSRIKYINI